eukprot:34381-Amorphochlora_amoeboformis.AAC.1
MMNESTRVCSWVVVLVDLWSIDEYPSAAGILQGNIRGSNNNAPRGVGVEMGALSEALGFDASLGPDDVIMERQSALRSVVSGSVAFFSVILIVSRVCTKATYALGVRLNMHPIQPTAKNGLGFEYVVDSLLGVFDIILGWFASFDIDARVSRLVKRVVYDASIWLFQGIGGYRWVSVGILGMMGFVGIMECSDSKKILPIAHVVPSTVHAVVVGALSIYTALSDKSLNFTVCDWCRCDCIGVGVIGVDDGDCIGEIGELWSVVSGEGPVDFVQGHSDTLLFTVGITVG